MSRFHVGGKVVDKVDLLRKKHWACVDFGDAAIVLGGLVALNILVWLFTAWSVDFKSFVHYSKVNDIYLADACKIIPSKFSGSKEVVPLHFRKQTSNSSSSTNVEEIYFDFRKQRFTYSKEKDTFFKLPYPTKETFGYYLKSTSHGFKAKVLSTSEKCGCNV
ncbi:hypothetical protein SLEP1_g3082 [Rubroshorea leprosula]|uniref:P5A-ATPase transmembrane helical hairpin domain-containing protein n=1 Tax=Rubroshorea leprosula TaxID=152421 RepID=A0AAV5HJ66_9ROSI|nr:hypothetical protein SLEP1_g3082 [Rubroshorea leprosula]